MNPSLVRMMIGEPCLTQSRVHFKLKLVAVPAGFWTGQARSRTAPSIVIIFALGSILVPRPASTGPSSDTLITVANRTWNKVERFISQSDRNLHHISRRKQPPRVPKHSHPAVRRTIESHNVTPVLCRSSSSVGGRDTEKRYGHLPIFSAVLAKPRLYWRLVERPKLYQYNQQCEAADYLHRHRESRRCT